MKTMKTLKNIAMLAILTGMIITSCQKESTSPSFSSLGVKIQATNKSFSVPKSPSAAPLIFHFITKSFSSFHHAKGLIFLKERDQIQ